MFRCILALLALASVVGASGLGSVVGSFDVPDRAFGVACSGPDVWVSFSNPVIHRYTTSGSFISSFPTGHTMTAHGLTLGYSSPRWYFWSAGRMDTTHNKSRVRQLSYPGGRFLQSFIPPNGEEGVYKGLAFNPSSQPLPQLYISDTKTRVIYRTSTTGTIVGSFYIHYAANLYDLAYDSRGSGSIWFVSATKYVYRADKFTGALLASFDVSRYGTPYGCGFEDGVVWVSFRGPAQVVGFTAGTTGVTPASLGKVKAMYK